MRGTGTNNSMQAVDFSRTSKGDLPWPESEWSGMRQVETVVHKRQRLPSAAFLDIYN